METEDPNKFRPYLYRYAVTLCKCPYAAEDLVQDTLFKADRALKRGRYQQGSNLRAWLCIIMRNVYINTWRRGLRFSSILGDIALQKPSSYEDKPLDRMNLEELLEVLRVAIPIETHYKVLVMALVQEYEYQEIADILGIPKGTVMSSLHRARKNAQRFLLEDHTYKDELHEFRDSR